VKHSKLSENCLQVCEKHQKQVKVSYLIQPLKARKTMQALQDVGSRKNDALNVFNGNNPEKLGVFPMMNSG
jgi:hypothetical protein